MSSLYILRERERVKSELALNTLVGEDNTHVAETDVDLAKQAILDQQSRQPLWSHHTTMVNVMQCFVLTLSVSLVGVLHCI